MKEPWGSKPGAFSFRATEKREDSEFDRLGLYLQTNWINVE
jgi:hypothetical protein